MVVFPLDSSDVGDDGAGGVVVVLLALGEAAGVVAFLVWLVGVLPLGFGVEDAGDAVAFLLSVGVADGVVAVLLSLAVVPLDFRGVGVGAGLYSIFKWISPCLSSGSHTSCVTDFFSSLKLHFRVPSSTFFLILFLSKQESESSSVLMSCILNVNVAFHCGLRFLSTTGVLATLFPITNVQYGSLVPPDFHNPNEPPMGNRNMMMSLLLSAAGRLRASTTTMLSSPCVRTPCSVVGASVQMNMLVQQ